jgi:hypothetical protein
MEKQMKATNELLEVVGVEVKVRMGDKVRMGLNESQTVVMLANGD